MEVKFQSLYVLTFSMFKNQVYSNLQKRVYWMKKLETKKKSSCYGAQRVFQVHNRKVITVPTEVNKEFLLEITFQR